MWAALCAGLLLVVRGAAAERGWQAVEAHFFLFEEAGYSWSMGQVDSKLALSLPLPLHRLQCAGPMPWSEAMR